MIWAHFYAKSDLEAKLYSLYIILYAFLRKYGISTFSSVFHQWTVLSLKIYNVVPNFKHQYFENVLDLEKESKTRRFVVLRTIVLFKI